MLVLTAQPAHKLRALQAGAKDFVSKPFDFVEVQTRIHNMLEVRLLYRKLNDHNRVLEQTVLERTAELRASEARFQRFTELSSDWYWEQDAAGNLTQFSGAVQEMLGIGESATAEEWAAAGWNVAERAALSARIANREPFLDFGLQPHLAGRPHPVPAGQRRADLRRRHARLPATAESAWTSPSAWNGRKDWMKNIQAGYLRTAKPLCYDSPPAAAALRNGQRNQVVECDNECRTNSCGEAKKKLTRNAKHCIISSLCC